MIADGITPRQTKFETDKAKLRRTIRQALSQAGSFDEFASLLLREGVTVKESRGRLSYLTPDRTKPITARKLGDDFDKAAVLALLTQNARRAAEQTDVYKRQGYARPGGCKLGLGARENAPCRTARPTPAPGLRSSRCLSRPVGQS